MNVKVCSDWDEPKYIDLKHEVWDDGIYSGINEIFLTYSEDRVCSIQVAYNDKSYILLAPKHGDDGTMFQKLKIHYPIISVSGHYEWTKGTFSSDKDLYCVTRSLTFKTSYATYGPYGREIGSPFCYQTDDGVAGFHGKVGGTSSQSYLSNLGVYVRSSATNAAK